MKKTQWTPTPTFLYRNYLYKKLTKGRNNKYFLEIGPGNGYFLRYLAKQNLNGISIDISKKAISYLKKDMENYPGIRLKNLDVFSLKGISKFNAIFAFEVLEHVKRDKEAIKKIYGLLKPGDIFYFLFLRK